MRPRSCGKGVSGILSWGCGSKRARASFVLYPATHNKGPGLPKCAAAGAGSGEVCAKAKNGTQGEGGC